MVGKTKSRKMGPSGVLFTIEEHALCIYIEDMAECGILLTPVQLKIKVGQTTQKRDITFKNKIRGPSWWRWFKSRHLELTSTTSQGMEHNRARGLNSNSTSKFYKNLDEIHTK